MTSIDIYRGSELFISIEPDDSSSQSKAVMGNNEVKIDFKSAGYIHFQLGDWCTIFGEKYFIIRISPVKKLSRFLYEYNLAFVVEGAGLQNTQYLFLGDDNSLKQSEFSLMGNAADFVRLIVDNANRISTGWTAGQVIDTDYKNLTFSRENCYNALSRLAEAFETEYWIEGKTIHLTKRVRNTGWSFRHGKNKGLYEIFRQTKDNSTVITRLYAAGSQKNLPAEYRNYSDRLKMVDGADYLQSNTELFGVSEHAEIFDDIYPTRTGKVTSPNATNFYMFADTGMDFDLNDYLQPNLPAKIVFNTGQLAGYEFEIASYDHGSKVFTINKNKFETKMDLPSILFKPAIGDQYVLVDIFLPQSYIDAAEAKLTLKAQSFLDANKQPNFSYSIVFDQVFLKRQGVAPTIGDVVRLIDDEYQVDKDIRVISTTRNLVNEYDIQVELSDMVSVGPIQRIISGVDSNTRDISAIDKAVQNNLSNNKFVGDVPIEQGTLIMKDLPTTNTDTGFSQLRIENDTGRIYKRI